MQTSTGDQVGSSWGSGEASRPEPRYLAVGRVVRPHGVRGEIRVILLTSYPERVASHRHVYLATLNTPDEVTRYDVERVRVHQDVMLLKLVGCDTRDAAQGLRGMLVQIRTTDAAPLGEGEYYTYQVEGLIVETDVGEVLGKVVDVIETGANDVYVVRGPRGEVLLPAIHEVVLEIDLTAGRMRVHLLPGLAADEGQ